MIIFPNEETQGVYRTVCPGYQAVVRQLLQRGRVMGVATEITLFCLVSVLYSK